MEELYFENFRAAKEAEEKEGEQQHRQQPGGPPMFQPAPPPHPPPPQSVPPSRFGDDGQVATKTGSASHGPHLPPACALALASARP
jgi:hypothetical protein